MRDFYWLYTPWASFLFGLGGWAWKPWRRFVLPFTGGWLAWRYGLPRWRCAAYAVSTAIVFSFGYDPQRHPWLVIGQVLTSYGLPPLFLFRKPLTVAWIPLVTGSVLFTAFFLSASVGLPHKLFEIAAGGLHGFWVSLAIHEHERNEK